MEQKRKEREEERNRLRQEKRRQKEEALAASRQIYLELDEVNRRKNKDTEADTKQEGTCMHSLSF